MLKRLGNACNVMIIISSFIASQIEVKTAFVGFIFRPLLEFDFVALHFGVTGEWICDLQHESAIEEKLTNGLCFVFKMKLQDLWFHSICNQLSE